jgi:tripartite-type tricarboxylate transporter receptor subunit TctC
MTRIFIRTLALALVVFTSGQLYAQDYPTKPIRIITGSVGGGNDAVARQIAQKISGPLGQPVVVDNRAGGSAISAEAGAKAPPDGYSLLVAGGALWIIPLLQKAPYDAVKDFAPITLISRVVSVVTVHPSLPVNSVKQLIALAKAKPGELNYANGGTGGSQHLATELFKSLAGVNIVAIPYKGGPPSLTAMLSGEVQVMINDLGLVAPQMKTGKLKPLAVTSATRSVLAPALPTVAESGLPGYEWVGASGIYAPAKTPEAIVARLNREIVRALNLPEVKEFFMNSGEEIVANTPEQFAATIKTEIAKTGKIIRDANIRVN